MKKIQSVLGMVLILTFLASCSFTVKNTTIKPTRRVEVLPTATDVVVKEVETEQPIAPPVQPTATDRPQEPTVIPTQVPTALPDANEINPLTGLPVDNPENLLFSPILVSVSNFPVSVRPHSGLSFAPHVFEMTIGDGETRFLAIYYGSYGPPDQMDVKLGSIRSGRLPYEDLRTMYSGLIVMAGAAPDVGAKLNATVFRESISFNGIRELAEDRANKKGSPEIEPILADATVQANGLDGTNLNIIWNYLNKVRWTYDAGSGKYLREQDKSDGKDTYFPTIDKLTGEQLSFDNVVLMSVEHNYLNPRKIEMNMLYVQKEPAIFFRDGKAYKIYWSSLAPLGAIKFFNADGTPFPYKPGNTFYEVISSMDEVGLQEDGSWKVTFFNP